MPADEHESSIDVSYRSPVEFLSRTTSRSTTDLLALRDLSGYSFGPAVVEEARLVCPDCKSETSPLLEAKLNSQEEFVEVRCPEKNCDWSERQPFPSDPSNNLDETDQPTQSAGGSGPDRSNPWRLDRQ